MIQRSDPWHTRSTLSKLAHILARLGLALIGASSGLFVAAAVAVIHQINSAEVLLTMMLYGAAAFYLGINLPQAPPGHRIGRRGLGTREVPWARIGRLDQAPVVKKQAIMARNENAVSAFAISGKVFDRTYCAGLVVLVGAFNFAAFSL